MNIRYARMQGERLAEELGKNSLPINVETIARKLKLKVIYANLGPKVSGLLISNDGGSQICVKEDDFPTRQRFTIAHELGHHVLGHQFESGEHVHVDKGNFISERGPRAADGVDPKEVEANQFAACLLMPSKLLLEKVTKLGGPPLFDDDVASLAKQFEVSEHAMTIRLTTLKLL
jgi:Zn-dependent peptidase ImmA (M78 family)